MPIKLRPPREGKTKNYGLRGTYLGVYVEQSAGTPDKQLAQAILKKIKRQIECGELTVTGGEPTFLSAAVAYMEAGGESQYLKPLIQHFGATPIRLIDQVAVDAAAVEIYPEGSGGTRNRQVHTPVASVIHYGGHPWIKLRRPKQATGRLRWVTPEQFGAFLDAAAEIEGEADQALRLTALALFLLYGGPRLGESLALIWETDVDLQQRMAFAGTTKNGDPRGIHLVDAALAGLANLPGRKGMVFGWETRSGVYKPWRAAAKAAGLPWFTPHVCRHTYATWMRRYAGLDLRGLLATNAWKDLKSVLRYQHVVASEEAKKADLLPTVSGVNPGSKTPAPRKSNA